MPPEFVKPRSILQESLFSRQYFWYYDVSLRRIQPEKRLRDERYKYHSANLKNVRVLAPSMLFDIELRQQ